MPRADAGTNGWREPTLLLPLRFGSYRTRYPVALGLLFTGGIALQFTSAYTLVLLAFGLCASVAGWIVLPAPGWRRVVAVGPALLGVASLLNGAQFGALLALTLAAWLLVRMRPLRSFIVLVLPTLASFVLGALFPQYGWGALVGAVMGVVLVASAWLARRLSVSVFAQRRTDPSQNRRNVP